MDRQRMMDYIGIGFEDELFKDVPEEVRCHLPLPKGMSEKDVTAEIGRLLSKNRHYGEMPSFLGAGCYDHFIPAAVDHVISRSEFYTSYTPYQPEMSQGMLQALFEYQSHICELTGLDAANCSMYDGATALGEAARMCARLNSGDVFLAPRAMTREKLSVLRNYLTGTGVELELYGWDDDGGVDIDDLESRITEKVCGLYAETPNLFGVIDARIPILRGMTEAPLVVGVNPLTLALMRAPGDMGADIVVGDGQCLGSPMNYGGPGLGLFACRQEHVRKMPGRVIGLTEDSHGEQAFCMTLQTREQHIRRGRATSNICTNVALVAVAAAVFMSYHGRDGLVDLAKENIERARRLMDLVSGLDNVRSPVFDNHHFNEFLVELPVKPEKINSILAKRGFQGGLPMSAHVPEMSDCMLLATTEMHDDATQDSLVAAIREVL